VGARRGRYAAAGIHARSVAGKPNLNITLQRCIPSQDEGVLPLFLKDTTYVDRPQDEFLRAGFLAVCDRFPEHDFYVASVYHEWFMVDNRAGGESS
jgi:hypothetical protein